DKAMAGAKSVVKASLNSLLEEVHRHKVAVGDALEASIRALDQQIATEQNHLMLVQPPPPQQQEQPQSQQQPQDAGSGATASAAAAAAAAVGGVRSDWYVPPAGGVPAPCP
ncbi:hypothetical protein Vretimale_7720, partial [Volvox reticuliferus]